jgi:hypothetical protein
MTLIEFCASCDSPSMNLIDSTYRPCQGEPLRCLLCGLCVTQMQGGDKSMKQALERCLLARRVGA